MQFYVYILSSDVNGQFYIGQTQDIQNRLTKHNKGYVKSTKSKRPWTLLFSYSCDTRSIAMSLEKKLKGFKSRKRVLAWINDQSKIS